MKIRLSAADRGQLGAPEVLDCDANQLMIDEAIDLEEQGALAGPDEWYALMRGKPMFEQGQPVLNERGEQRFRTPAKAWKALVWLGLRRAGVAVRYADLTFDYGNLAIDVDTPTPDNGDSDGGEPAGKDSAP